MTKSLLAFCKWIHRFLKRGGGNIHLPRTRFLFISRILRTGLTDTFRAEIAAGDVVIDVGANIGYYSILASELVGRTGAVHSFEPDPHHYQLFTENIASNKRENISAEQQGVSEHAGALQLYLSEANSSDHSTYWVPGRRSVEVPVVSLDEYCSACNLTKVDFIKIDVQGFELSVLRGMEGILQANPGVKVLSEFWPNGIRRAKEDPKEYLDVFENLGFRFYLVEERALPRPVSKEEAWELAHAREEIDLLMKRESAV